MSASGKRIFRRSTFDDLFGAAEDPWNYSSHYETTKYRQTLRLIPQRQAGQALEIGCAEGHFTAQLALRVKHLTAVDISALALKRAGHRCASFRNVAFAQLDVFEDALSGPFDLIVCSEILYYAADLSALDRVAGSIVDALAPSGFLVTAHAHLTVDGSADAGFDWNDHVAGAAGIERALLSTGRVKLDDEIRTDLYRVQRYVRVRSRTGLSASGEHHRRTEPTGVLPPSLGASVVWGRGTRELAEQRLTVLAYHRVSEEGPRALDPYRVGLPAFDAQLRLLWEAGYRTVPLERWRHPVRDGDSLPKLPLLLTFDDGYLDFLTNAWPILKRYGFSALVSVVTDCVGGWNEWDARHGPPIPLMGWRAILELHRQGVEFAAHTATHRRLTRLDSLRAAREIWRSKVQLEEQLSKEVTTFVYPFGDTDRRVESLVDSCGFVCAFGGGSGVASADADPFKLPRIEVQGGQRPEMVLEEISRARARLTSNE